MSTLLEQASLVMIPSGYKEDVVYSQIPTSGSGDLSFTRASNGTRINSAGLVEVVPWNLLQYSQLFQNGVWATKQGTFTDNFAVAPNGTTTACKWEATNSDPYCYQSYNGDNVSYTATCWVKATGTAIGKNCSIRIGGSAVFTAMTGEWQQLIITANINGSVNVGVEAPESATIGEIVYIWGFQINLGSTAKPYFPTTDRLNVPRLTYQNGGGGCPSLLLEPQRTNLALYSEQFDNAYWTKGDCTITSNNDIAPDGTMSADRLVPNANNSYHRIISTVISTTIGQYYSVSLFVKKNDFDFFYFREGIGTFNNTFFNISNGTIGTVAVGRIAKIEDYGDGWYRCSISTTASTTSSQVTFGFSESDNVAIFIGNNVKYNILWGAQIEAGAYPTSYIPTTTASATRVADDCRKTGISSLIGQTEGTVYLEFDNNALASYPNEHIFSIRNTAGSSQLFIRKEVSSNVFTVRLIVGGVTIFTNTSSTPIDGINKIAVSYKTGDSSVFLNGTQRGSTSTSAFSGSSFDDLYLNSAGSLYPELLLKQLLVFPTRLTNAELASLTTL